MSLRQPDPYSGQTCAGIDVSAYQKNINWGLLASAQEHIRYAIAREGDALSTDSTFLPNYKGAKSAGLIPGAYQFVRPLVDPVAQAQRLTHALQSAGFEAGVDMPPVIDVERGDDPSFGNDRVVHDPIHVGNQMLLWINTIEAALKVRPMIYAGAFFAQAIHDDRLGAYSLWTPEYGVAYPGIPMQWARHGAHWSIWQYDSTHGIAGIDGHAVDHDVYRGTEVDLRAFCAASKL